MPEESTAILTLPLFREVTRSHKTKNAQKKDAVPVRQERGAWLIGQVVVGGVIVVGAAECVDAVRGWQDKTQSRYDQAPGESTRRGSWRLMDWQTQNCAVVAMKVCEGCRVGPSTTQDDRIRDGPQANNCQFAK